MTLLERLTIFLTERKPVTSLGVRLQDRLMQRLKPPKQEEPKKSPYQQFTEKLESSDLTESEKRRLSHKAEFNLQEAQRQFQQKVSGVGLRI